MAYTVYLNRNNAFDISFRDDTRYASEIHPLITKFELIFTDLITLSSALNPECFDFGTDVITVNIGAASVVPIGNYKAKPVLYFTDKPNGEIWGLPISLSVVSE